MQLLDAASISRPGGNATIRVLCGDLAEHARPVDLIVVTRDDYYTSAFMRRGIRLPPFSKALSNCRIEHKRYRSWLVEPLHYDLRAAVLTFEPIVYETLVVAFRYLFDTLVQLVSLGDRERLSGMKSIALPVLLAGPGGFAVQDAARPLMLGLIHWLAIGVPLDRVDFVIPSRLDAASVADILREEIASYLTNPVATRQPARYDVFLSYSRHDSAETEVVASELRKISPNLRVFRDVEACALAESGSMSCSSRSMHRALCSPCSAKNI